jgi:hypothetical protein
VDPNETVETLKAKVQALEGECLVEVVRKLQRQDLKGRREEGGRKEGGATYKEAGVDIEAGDDLVENIKPFCKGTARKGSDGIIGGFGGIFDLKVCRLPLLSLPLVSLPSLPILPPH